MRRRRALIVAPLALASSLACSGERSEAQLGSSSVTSLEGSPSAPDMTSSSGTVSSPTSSATPISAATTSAHGTSSGASSASMGGVDTRPRGSDLAGGAGNTADTASASHSSASSPDMSGVAGTSEVNAGAGGASDDQGGVSSGGTRGIAGSAGIGGAGGNAAGAGDAAAGGGSAGDGITMSKGCGNSRSIMDGNGSVQSGGTQRTYILRSPEDYDNTHPYRLMLGFHGATGNASEVAPSFFGIWELAEGSTIFVAPDAVGGIWDATKDTTLVSDLIEQLSNDLCIDTSRIGIEGFSQGAAMVWTLACGLPGTFRFAVVHSGGGLPMPQACEPIPFWSALGTDGSGQDMSSDFFARTNGCTVDSLPTAPTGGHVCTNYADCDPGFPTRWCDYDAGHTPSAVDTGQQRSWVPDEVWNFIKDY
ncbi:MAG TPA: hypothetical protein VHM70_20875 [Polyangiaceae bacterium]|nr:hypothetical protein [Polyangiaceae bacterium]